MHPYFTPGFHNWHHGRHWHRGPSRLLWFAVGAVSASAWIKHRDWHARHGSGYYGHCYRAPVQTPQPPAVQPSPYPGDGRPAEPASMMPTTSFPKSIPETINRIPPAQEFVPSVPWVFGHQHQEQRWQEEKERMWDLGRQAGDAMAELSESTLDSVVSAVETLKAKLAEQRVRREEQQKQIERQFEAETKKPFRWV